MWRLAVRISRKRLKMDEEEEESACRSLHPDILSYFHNKLNFNFPVSVATFFSHLVFAQRIELLHRRKKPISNSRRMKGELCTLKSIFQHEGFCIDARHKPIIKTNKISNFFFPAFICNPSQ